MKFAFYPGCLAQTEQYACEISTRRVLPELGIEFVDLEGLSCCGDPLASISKTLTMYLAARNLAMAASEGLPLLTICNSCYLTLVEAKAELDSDAKLREKVAGLLSIEGLEYRKFPEVVHVVSLLHDVIGIDELQRRTTRRMDSLKVALQVGCHLLRPSDLLALDDPERPAKLVAIIGALGAEAISYPGELECCGAGLLALKSDAALTYANLKLKSIRASGADVVVTPCPGCFKMLDGKQRAILSATGGEGFPVLYLMQLVGLALGIPAEELGLELNQSPLEKLSGKLPT